MLRVILFQLDLFAPSSFYKLSCQSTTISPSLTPPWNSSLFLILAEVLSAQGGEPVSPSGVYEEWGGKERACIALETLDGREMGGNVNVLLNKVKIF